MKNIKQDLILSIYLAFPDGILWYNLMTRKPNYSSMYKHIILDQTREDLNEEH